MSLQGKHKKDPSMIVMLGSFELLRSEASRLWLDAVVETRRAIEEEHAVDVLGDRTQVGVLGVCVHVVAVGLALSKRVHRG